jgi:putative toxin-antitoxin system antitoxin component (TIGR02293 family)
MIAAPIADIARLLGGAKVVGKMTSALDLHERVRSGLPYGALLAVGEQVELPPSRLAALIGLAPATYARRRRSRRLAKPESEVLARVARVLVIGKRALGSIAATHAWLERSNAGFAGARPRDLLLTEDGGREVEAALGRLIFGGYA